MNTRSVGGQFCVDRSLVAFIKSRTLRRIFKRVRRDSNPSPRFRRRIPGSPRKVYLKAFPFHREVFETLDCQVTIVHNAFWHLLNLFIRVPIFSWGRRPCRAHFDLEHPLVELHAAVGAPGTKKVVVNQDKSANSCFNIKYDLGWYSPENTVPVQPIRSK
jgi:hypothetical protein